MEITFFSVLDLLGTFAFALSGATQALKKQFDIFGVFVLAFVTAIGGGTLRDIILGDTPVGWMNNNILIATVVIAAAMALMLNPIVSKLNFFIYIFDALGLGLFTVAGIRSGLNHDLNIFMCIALGMMSATFGGLIRDIISGEKPMLLTRKEIYALACGIGGVMYFILRYVGFADAVNVPATILIIFFIRHLTYRYKITLPSLGQR